MAEEMKSKTGLQPLVLLGVCVAFAGSIYGADPAALPPAAPVQDLSNAPKPATSANLSTNLPKIEANESVMVTVELDFEPPIPSIVEALKQIQRRYQPEDGKGRTFAILDAYGGPTEDGKKLHISMHVSAEKPGTAALVFKAKSLWETRVVPSTHPPSSSFAGKGLLIMVNDDQGKARLLNGTT